jgi:phage gp36-like protein
MFLTPLDYNQQIQSEIKTAISSNPAVWSQAALSAQEEAESYLRSRFDTVAIFTAIGAARNMFLVTILVDMVLYHVHARVAARAIPEDRTIRYEAAIDYLRACAKGSVTPDLPILETPDGAEIQPTRYGSNTKQKHIY